MAAKTSKKRQWAQHYAKRMMRAWQAWQTPLGIDKNYAHELETQLTDYFDDPLKRSLIEQTY